MHKSIADPSSELVSTPNPPALELGSSVFALVRHGQTAWNAAGQLQGHTDLSLNETGRRQADEAGHALAGRPWDVVVSSPLRRAQQTARRISRILGLDEDPLIEPGLIEQTFGVAEGLPAEDARTRWPDGDFPGGETRAQVAQRVADTWNRITSDYAGSRVIVVCHGVVIRCLSEQLVGVDPGIVPNGSTTVLAHAAGSWIAQ